jgi:catechol 2,3-dioxygenase-like lactoylglutathione lyase family enzyme
MALKRMDNVGIVVDDLGGTIDFFRELGLELEGRATIEGEWAGRVTGLADQRVEIAMMRTPDGHGRNQWFGCRTCQLQIDREGLSSGELRHLSEMMDRIAKGPEDVKKSVRPADELP